MTPEELTPEELAQLARMRYVNRLPRKLPAGFILVHNHVLRNRVRAGLPHSIGLEGGRCWLQEGPGTDVARCDCGWRTPGIAEHYGMAWARLDGDDG